MPVRKEDEIMAEYLLKGGKMLEKTCRTCGCPLFEVKGKTLCVVCAENEAAEKEKKDAKKGKKAAPVPEKAGTTGPVYDSGSFTRSDSALSEELASTIRFLCTRVRDEKDAGHILTLMNAVKAGCEALDILRRR